MTTPIEELTVDERLALIGALCDILDDDESAPSNAERAKVDRRLEAFDQQRADAAPWATVRAEIVARLPITP